MRSVVLAALLVIPVAFAQGVDAPVPAHEIPPIEELDIGNIEDLPAQEIVEVSTKEDDVYLEEVDPNAAPFPLDTMPKNTSHKQATVRLLTFSNNELQDQVLAVNQPFDFQDLTLILRGCRADVNNLPENDMAWVDVYSAAKADGAEQPEQPEPKKTQPQTGEENLLFSGWLLNQYTDAHTLEHPKYDLRLVTCK